MEEDLPDMIISPDASKSAATMVPGEQSATTRLTMKKLKWFAEALALIMDSQEHVRFLEEDLAAYSWIIWSALAMKAASLNVLITDGAIIIVDMVKMLASFAR